MAGSYISPPASNLFSAPPNFIDANQQTLIYCTVAGAILIVHKLEQGAKTDLCNAFVFALLENRIGIFMCLLEAKILY